MVVWHSHTHTHLRLDFSAFSCAFKINNRGTTTNAEGKFSGGLFILCVPIGIFSKIAKEGEREREKN